MKLTGNSFCYFTDIIILRSTSDSFSFITTLLKCLKPLQIAEQQAKTAAPCPIVKPLNSPPRALILWVV